MILMREPKILTPNEEPDAYMYWRAYHYPFRDEEDLVEPFLRLPATWPDVIRRTRDLQFLSQEAVARNAGLTRQAYSRLEREEKKGKITLERMHALAAALACDFVYAFRPKSQIRFSQQIFDHILPTARCVRAVHNVEGDRLKRQIAAWVGRFQHEPSYRKANGWRTEPPHFRY